MTEDVATMSGGPVTEPPHGTSRRPGHWSRSGGALWDVVAVLGTYLVLGVLCGLLWWMLVDPAMYTKLGPDLVMDPQELGKRFDGDGWYAVIGVVAGLVSGCAVTWWRARDFRLTTVLLVVGACLAAAAMAGVGYLLGPADPHAALASAREGDQIPVQLLVTAKAAYLVWPISALVGALMVLWSPPKDEIR